MHHGFIFKTATALAVVATLAACEGSEERAERHFQSGLALLEEGDVERALIEFRNVFDLDGSHSGPSDLCTAGARTGPHARGDGPVSASGGAIPR